MMSESFIVSEGTSIWTTREDIVERANEHEWRETSDQIEAALSTPLGFTLSLTYLPRYVHGRRKKNHRERSFPCTVYPKRLARSGLSWPPHRDAYRQPRRCLSLM